MTTDNFCFYLQNRQIQTSQTGGQWYSDTSPFSIPWWLLFLNDCGSDRLWHTLAFCDTELATTIKRLVAQGPGCLPELRPQH